MDSVEWIEGNAPGLVGEIVRWHGLHYVKALGWAPVFESLCAEQMGEIGKHLEARNDVTAFSAWSGGEFLGAVVMDGRRGARAGPRLRFFIATEAARGQGIGHGLMERAIAWSAALGTGPAWLTTVAGLGAAAHIYRKFGFRLVEEHVDHTWGDEHREQLWER